MRISLNQQIEAIEHEIKESRSPALKRDLRKPGVRKELEYQIARLEAVSRTLCWLRAHELAIKSQCPDLFTGETK